MHHRHLLLALIFLAGMVLTPGPDRKPRDPDPQPSEIQPEVQPEIQPRRDAVAISIPAFDRLFQNVDRIADDVLADVRSYLASLPPCPKRASDHVDPDDLWMRDYADAMTAAELRRQMLLIHFCDPGEDSACCRFHKETLDDPQVRAKLCDYVCVRLPMNATITVDGQRQTLLEHPAFAEMLGRPGVAILDFRSSEPALHGAVVSAFPITDALWYTPRQMAVILDLPPGTLTQRTLIYAVRIHPERPASADGQLSPYLLEEAESHSQHQAAIRLQGHHQWDSRFQRILARLPGGLTAREVCAESWPGEHLVEAAIECVRCWRLSDGHWSAVRSPCRCFGYDMKRGDNGIWYATGIFGAR